VSGRNGEPVRGCADGGVHAGHVWNAVVRGRRGDAQKRWCPGRVRCVECGKNVFRTTATETRDGYICQGGCRK